MENDHTMINRRGFGLKEEVKPLLQESYYSPLIEKIKGSNYALQTGRLTIRLAEEFGFCYGVDRAIDLAYETRKRFPEKKIYLTSEIIHNQRVNTKLRDMGIKFLSDNIKCEDFVQDSLMSIEDVRKEDVILIPAFGTSTGLLNRLKAKECILVDTTCGSVIAVWRRVEKYAQDGFTAIVHGKFNHEETQATISRAGQYPDGKYLVVYDKKEARLVADYILGKGNSSEFLNVFSAKSSSGFDPDQDLVRVGCANQTTMLSSESLEIADIIQKAMKERYGESKITEHFRHFDTICSATQDRQDAVLKLARGGLDLMVIVGGYNSSNTGHLCEISSEFAPAYHVQDAGEIISKEEIRHKPAGSKEVVVTRGWLPQGPVKIGITAGASTPNRLIEEVISRIIQCSGETAEAFSSPAR